MYVSTLSYLTTPSVDDNNYGNSISYGAGINYVLIFFEHFDTLYGYTFCDYTSYLQYNTP